MLSLCLIKDHTMKMYKWMNVQFHTVLTSVLDGGEQSDPCLAILSPRETPSTHWIGDWVNPRGLVIVAKTKSLPLPVIKPWSSTSQPSNYTEISPLLYWQAYSKISQHHSIYKQILFWFTIKNIHKHRIMNTYKMLWFFTYYQIPTQACT
jgi:hypothetical protein